MLFALEFDCGISSIDVAAADGINVRRAVVDDDLIIRALPATIGVDSPDTLTAVDVTVDIDDDDAAVNFVNTIGGIERMSIFTGA